jgi:hypothetical protein
LRFVCPFPLLLGRTLPAVAMRLAPYRCALVQAQATTCEKAGRREVIDTKHVHRRQTTTATFLS